MTGRRATCLVLLLSGCPTPDGGGPKDGPSGHESGDVDTAGETGGDGATDTAIDTGTDTGSDTGADTGEDSAVQPGVMPLVDCATVIYGDSSVQPALWVNAAASTSGDGSETAPFVALADALAAATDLTVIWVAAGDYAGGVSIDVSGVAVVGEGREATRILGSDATANVESNPREGGGTALCALTLEGGAPGVVAESGELALYDVAVTGASGAGVVARGEGRSLRLDGVSVGGTRVGTGDGTGVDVSQGASAEVANSDISDNEGIGVFANADVPLLHVSDSRIDGNGHGVAEDAAGGLIVLSCDEVVLESLQVDANVARGIEVQGARALTMDGCAVTDTDATGVVASGVRLVGGSRNTLSESTISGGSGVGLWLFSADARLSDAVVTGVGQAADGTAGVGVALANNSGGYFTRVASTANGRAGVALNHSSVRCDECELSENVQVGLVHQRSRVELDGAVVLANGYAGLMHAEWGTESITVSNSTFGPHPYAAIWAWNSLRLAGNTVYGSEGVESGGEIVDGFAVYIEAGFDVFEANEFLDAENVAVVGAGFLGDLSGNTWDNPGTDFVAVKTADAETIGGLDEIPEYELNPADAPLIVEPPVEVDAIWAVF